MLRDGFTFAVLIGGELDFIGGFNGFFQFVDDFCVVGVDFVGDLESGLVDFSVFSDMTDRS